MLSQNPRVGQALRDAHAAEDHTVGAPTAVVRRVEPRETPLVAEKAAAESMGWLAASEGTFPFWDNEDDDVWDEVVEVEDPAERREG